MAVYKIILNKSVAFLYTKDKQAEKEIRETTLFTIIKNNIKYEYGFSADTNRIYTEYLYQYLTAKPSLIFDRTNVNEYKFTQQEQGKLKELTTKNTEKKLFLSTATEWNYEKTRDAYMWFAENIDTYDNYMEANGFAFNQFENDTEGSLKKFTINLLKEADILIDDYNFEIENVNVNNLLTFSNSGKISSQNAKSVKISTLHEIENENGEIEKYELDLLEESLGTQSLFFFSPILKDAFEKGIIETEGTGISSILPPMSRFSKTNDRQTKKKNVISKLLDFFDKFFVLTNTFMNDDPIEYVEQDNKDNIKI